MNKSVSNIEIIKDKVKIVKRIKAKRKESFNFLFDMIDTLFTTE